MRDFCHAAIDVLNAAEPSQFGQTFVELRMDFHRKFGNKLIISTWHGLDFFKNVIFALDNGAEALNEPKGEYRNNFISLIKLENLP